jgi:hypothetical protein
MIMDCPMMDSLAFAHSLPLLQQMQVNDCARMPASELHHLCELPALHTLSLENCFTQPLDDFIVNAFTPGASGYLMGDRLPALIEATFEN